MRRFRFWSLCSIRHPLDRIPQGMGFDFTVSLLAWGMFVALVWCFDLIEGEFQKAFLSLIFVALPVSLCSETGDVGEGISRSKRAVQWTNRGLALLLMTGLAIQFSERVGWVPLGFNVAMIWVSSPFIWAFWMLIRREWLLSAGLIPSLLITFAYLIILLVSPDKRLDYFLFPLPTILVAGILWALVAWPCLFAARGWQSNPVLGPAVETLLMFILFAPMIVLTAVAPEVIPLRGPWSMVPVTIASVSLGAVISVPLRKFLRNLGRLSSTCRSVNGIDDN